MAPEHFDVLIIGAGLSGIDAAYHLQKLCPHKSYAILEQRAKIGGTWDLFRYPGIRSDSDMFTMCYSFRPWTSPEAISPGEDILNYIVATAQEAGIDRHIRFRHTVQSAAWSSASAQWQVTASRELPNRSKESVTLTCNFLFSCAGYYRYSSGYLPEFPTLPVFQGAVIHPQAWPQDFDYNGKRLVIIGSGATAVTLLPAIAKTAAHVTMLQRSPTYMVSLPEQDPAANWLRENLPWAWAYRLSRWKNVAFGFGFYQFAQLFPNLVKAAIFQRVSRAVGPNCDALRHFSPRYNPWQQRLCVVPNGDLFKAIQAGQASVITDQIKSFTADGIELESGQTLKADVIVTATGLVMQYIGGMQLSVDGQPIQANSTVTYKGVMNSGIPNFASVFGYINASWTLKADLICQYVCRLLNYMDKKGVRQVMPKAQNDAGSTLFVENFTSGYVRRDLQAWPRQSGKAPWRNYQNYFKDFVSLRWSGFNNKALQFSNPVPRAASGESSGRFAKTTAGE